MIRIDEIYNHTFWPWLDKNKAGTRMFFCDPPGHTDPEHLFNLGRDDVIETDYVFFHDQEPVHLDSFENLFNTVELRNLDIAFNENYSHAPLNWEGQSFREFRQQHNMATLEEIFKDKKDLWNTFKILNQERFIKPKGHIVVSERGEYVEQLAKQYGWTTHYYFFHGWACMDWYRGYDKTFLIPRARDRQPTQTFISPNRIVAGKRDHRVLFLYNVFKHGLGHNHISAPRVCQYENIDISIVAQKYTDVYQDISTVFDQAQLPRLFVGEDTQQMSSCWLTNFDEAVDSLVYVPTETVYFGRRQHITEKTFKAIALEMPFVLVAPAGSLAYMREYGFQTFNDIFDESYDEESNDVRRIELVTKLLKDLDNLTIKERQQIHRACLPRVEHNYNHFYRGGFSDVLWPELTNMLNGLKV
jgi:hypothetical protein